MFKDLLDRATTAELGQHLAMAQAIIADEVAGPRMVAYLLKNYGRGQGRRALPDRPRNSPARSVAYVESPGGVTHVDAAVSHVDATAGMGEAEGQERRRRRRRRGRNKVGVVTLPGQARAPSAGAQASQPFEIVDAKDLLRDASACLATPAPAPPIPVGAGTHAAVTAVGPDLGGRRARRVGSRSVGPVAGLSVEDGANHDAGTAAGVGEDFDVAPRADDGLVRVVVNIGFDDGFKGRGAVAKKVAALAGLSEGMLFEEEARRDSAVLKACAPVAALVRERVDGAQLGKKTINVTQEL